MKTKLFVIDGQNDFCDLPEKLWGSDGSRPQLPVAGAHADMIRLGFFLDQTSSYVDELVLTFDSHPFAAIERPAFWMTGEGGDVAPFTLIKAEQVAQGEYLPRNKALLPYVLSYLQALEKGGKYVLMVWTTHCVTGSWGHGLHPALLDSVNKWEARSLKSALRVMKGMNPLTEQYSAIRAEVPLKEDPSTDTNYSLLKALTEDTDKLIIAGEASSHCVKASTLDVVQYCGIPDFAKKMILLTDCMSPVTGFEAQGEEFLVHMASLGARLTTSDVLAAELAK